MVVKFLFGSEKDQEKDTEANEETSSNSFEMVEDDSATSAHVMEAKERENSLNLLRSNASKLIADLSSIEQLISTSETSADELLGFIDQSKIEVEKAKRLKIESQRLASRNAELESRLKQNAEELARNAA